MRGKGKLLVIVLVVAIVVGVWGYLATLEKTPSKPTSAPKVLRIGTTMPIKTDNIFADYYFGIVEDVFNDRLFAIGERGEIVPELVESWRVEEDGKIWILRIVKNATWHDGKKLTAEDVSFSINYLKAKVPAFGAHLALVKKAETLDDYTVKITLEKPWTAFLANLIVVRVIPKHVWEKVENPLEYYGSDRNIGSGPFVFKGFDSSSGTITFEANPNYREGKPKVDLLIFRLYKNTEAELMALKKGDIDTTYFYARGLDPIYVPALLADPNVRFLLEPNFGVDNALWFNNKLYPYSVKEFRVAISYALNYSEYVRAITAGYAENPKAGFVPPGWKYYKETRELVRNLTIATEILDSIGFKDYDGDGWRDLPNGTAFTMKIMMRSDLPEATRVAELIKRDLEEVGIRVKLVPLDVMSFRTVVDRERSHEVVISRTTMWGMMMWAGYGSGYVDSRNIGWANVEDAEFHRIVDEMLKETDENKIRGLAHKLQEMYAENLYMIPLYWGKIIQPYRVDRVDGLVYTPMMGILNHRTWFSVEVKD